METKTTKILVIDDEDAMRRFMIEILGLNGYPNVLQASSGEEGIRMIGEHNPDLVITDLTMPGGMRGEQVLSWIKNQHKPAFPNIKAMAYSGDGEATTETVSRAAGADGFLAKPFLPQVLIAVIEAVLAQP